MAHILIVEDDERLAHIYDFVFLKQGHTVTLTNNGLEGLQKAEEQNPDIILLDMMMPNMSGLEFLEKFDVKNKHSNTKIVVFSNLEDEAAMKQAIELGAARYEIKSTFTPNELSKLVSDLLSSPAS